MVVDEVLAAVDHGEECDFDSFWTTVLVGLGWVRDVEDVRGADVEVAGVPVHGGGEVGYVETEVAELEVVSE